MNPERRRPFLLGRPSSGGPSRYRGVIWHKSNGKWEARIYEAGKQRFLGYFTSELAAAEAYDTRAVHLHGVNAKINFPEKFEVTKHNPPASKLMPRRNSSKALKDERPRPCQRRKRAMWDDDESSEASVELSDEEELEQEAEHLQPKPSDPISSKADAASDADSHASCNPYATASRLESSAIEVLAALRKNSSRQSSPSFLSVDEDVRQTNKLPTPVVQDAVPKIARPASGILIPLPRRASAEDVKHLMGLTKAPGAKTDVPQGKFATIRKRGSSQSDQDNFQLGPEAVDRVAQRWAQASAPTQEATKRQSHPSESFKPKCLTSSLAKPLEDPLALLDPKQGLQVLPAQEQLSPFAAQAAVPLKQPAPVTPSWTMPQAQAPPAQKLRRNLASMDMANPFALPQPLQLAAYGSSQAMPTINTASSELLPMAHELAAGPLEADRLSGMLRAVSSPQCMALNWAQAPCMPSMEDILRSNQRRSLAKAEGVHYDLARKRWLAAIRMRGSLVDLGAFHTSTEAQVAFWTATQLLHITGCMSAEKGPTRKPSCNSSRTQLAPIDRSFSHSIQPTGKVLDRAALELEANKARNLYSGPLPKRQKAF